MKTYIMYEIKCNDANVEFYYVGHTTNFRNRKYAHKQNCNNENGKNYNAKIYKFIRENGNWDNWSMIPLEEHECENTIQSRIREQYWIDVKQSKLNSVRAYTSAEQEHELNKITKKQYRTNNQDTIRAYNQHYSIDNKESIKDYQKIYYNDNKQAIQEKAKQVIVCECGVKTTQQHKPRHMRTARHLELMSKLNL